jgi:hypothetical protein
MAVWYNLWPFVIVSGHLLYFSRFGMFWTKKNLATLVMSTLRMQKKVQTIGSGTYLFFYSIFSSF